MNRRWPYLIVIALLVLALEFVREAAPLESPMGPSKHIYTYPQAGKGPIQYVKAEGVWLVTTGDQLVPHGVQIACDVAAMTCRQTTVNFFARAGLGNSFEINDDVGEITDVTPTTLSFRDESPACVRYRTTIDSEQGRIIAQRIAKEPPLPELCQGKFDLIQMELSDGYSVQKTLTEAQMAKSFHPVLSILFWLLGTR